MTISGIEIWGVMIPLLLALLAIFGLVLDMSVWRERPRAQGIFILAGLLVIILVQYLLQAYRLTINSNQGIGFGGQIYFDLYSVFFNYIFLIAAAVTVLLSLTYMEGKEDHRGEYYILLVIATIGMCLMASAHDLLILFIGIETMSIAVYVLVGFERKNLKSNEGSIKYLLLGAFASGILLYGMALIYGATGSIDYRGIPDALILLFGERAGLEERAIVETAAYNAVNLRMVAMMAGTLMFFAGLFFKVAAAPFHMWTPDVYEGAPTPITAYMATAVKAAAFAGLLRVLLFALPPLWGYKVLYLSLSVLAVLTMTLGNVTAIAQKNLKRMLAYSSIAHAGYLLVGVTSVVASIQFVNLLGAEVENNAFARALTASSSIMFYLLAYAFMNLGAFGVIAMVTREKPEGETLRGFSGLSRRRPGLAAVMAICMLSLAGVPPLAGFAAKFYVFQSAVNSRLYFLAIIGVLNSVISAYYYLRVIVVMYMEPEQVEMYEPGGRLVTGASVANVVMAALVVMLGLFPQPMFTFIDKAFEAGMLDLIIHFGNG